MAEGDTNDGAGSDDLKSWLTRYSAQGWIDRSLRELAVAEQALADHQPPAAAAAMKRAAGMALNGALRVVPRRDWGRSYVEHLKALAEDRSVPKAVSEAADTILHFTPQPGTLVFLRSPGKDNRLLEATRTVMAHAYAIVNGGVGRATGTPKVESDE
jgi:hypothetical protein